jgi:mannitol/fructose-specific phosphotransferase system IIA component (Ntr-type)
MAPVRNWLLPQQIGLDLDAHGKSEALHAIATLLKCSSQTEAEPIFRALYRREQAGSTGIGDGIAIPHARIPGIDQPVTLFARTRLPIRFGAPDGKLVSEFFVILVPAEGATEIHLQLLRGAAEMFSDRTFRASLVAADTASAIADVFAHWAERPEDGPVDTIPGTS